MPALSTRPLLPEPQRPPLLSQHPPSSLPGSRRLVPGKSLTFCAPFVLGERSAKALGELEDAAVGVGPLVDAEAMAKRADADRRARTVRGVAADLAVVAAAAALTAAAVGLVSVEKRRRAKAVVERRAQRAMDAMRAAVGGRVVPDGTLGREEDVGDTGGEPAEDDMDPAEDDMDPRQPPPSTPEGEADWNPFGGVPSAADLPSWLDGPAVWRVALEGLGEANVPLPPSDNPGGEPERCWLAFEAEADAAAFKVWLTESGGPLVAEPGPSAASVNRAAPEQMSAEAAASGRVLVYLPKGAVKIIPGAPEQAVLAALAAGAHSDRAGTVLLTPDQRVAAEAWAEDLARKVLEEDEAERDGSDPASPTSPSPADTPAARAAADVLARITPPADPLWWRARMHLAVPVLGVGESGAGLMTVGGGDVTRSAVVAFEDASDADAVARAWHACGAAETTGAAVKRIVAMTPDEVAREAGDLGCRLAVFPAGAAPVVPGCSYEELVAMLAAAAAALAGEPLIMGKGGG